MFRDKSTFRSPASVASLREEKVMPQPSPIAGLIKKDHFNSPPVMIIKKKSKSVKKRRISKTKPHKKIYVDSLNAYLKVLKERKYNNVNLNDIRQLRSS